MRVFVRSAKDSALSSTVPPRLPRASPNDGAGGTSASDPQFAQDANFSLGYLLLKQGSAKEAVAPLEQAARLNPRHMPTQMLLGNAYLSVDRVEEGLAAFGESCESFDIGRM